MNNEIFLHKILRPHRSISIRGQQVALYVVMVAALVAAPAIIATGFWWMLLVLLSPVVILFVAFFRRNKDSQLYEEITITRQRLILRRIESDGTERNFETDPYWVKIEKHDNGPVEAYVTLRDKKRHVEIGAFLSPKARLRLFHELRAAQNRAQNA